MTARHLKDRLTRETRTNVSLQVNDTDTAGAFEIHARGEMQIAILVEQMRRESFEIMISRPEVIFHKDDLGNVLDETWRVAEATQTYLNALQLAPTYADAHYNLALAYEKMKEPRKALKHWQAYVRLDGRGPWSVHARTQIKRILKSESLRIVYGGNAGSQS